MSLLAFTCEKIQDKSDPNAKPAMVFDSKTLYIAERDKEVKNLVWNSTAGKAIIIQALKCWNCNQYSLNRNDNIRKEVLSPNKLKKKVKPIYIQVAQKAKDQREFYYRHW